LEKQLVIIESGGLQQLFGDINEMDIDLEKDSINMSEFI